MPSPRCAGNLLGPCFNTGPTSRLASCTFCLSSYQIIFIFPSRYFFAIGLLMYLALDAYTTLSHCTTKQCYSSIQLALRGLSPPLAPLSIGFSSHSYNYILPLELLLVRSPLLKKSKFVSSPVLTDMLKSRTYSCISASFQPHVLPHDYRILYVGRRQRNLSIPYMSSSSQNHLLSPPMVKTNIMILP